MVSSIRRKVRRYLLGVTRKATRMWWIGEVTVRVMDVSVCKSTRPLREKAHYVAEKSPVHNRKMKGSTAMPPTDIKAQSSRAVNHSGRKFLWALKASSGLRADCKKLNKFPRGEVTNPVLQSARLKMKLHCLAKWQRLHKHATAAGIPPVAAFHDSFWKYLMVETSRGSTKFGWDMILAGLPQPSESGTVLISIPARGGRSEKRVTVSRDQFVPRKRVCRACGYLGSGPHLWNECRPPSGPKANGSRRQSGGRGAGSSGRSIANLF